MVKINTEAVAELSFDGNEAYRTLRTNLVHFGNDIKVIAITSPIPKEGKTSVAFNIAISMTEINKKVLFIDADLRKSVLMERFEVNDKINGFECYLSGQNDFGDVVYRTNIENLNIVLSEAGRPDSTELLCSPYFNELIPSIKDKYDYIIIDTPALGNVIDGAIVAQKCDGVIVVIQENVVSNKLAKKVISQLEEIDCRILGVVLNKVKIFKNNKCYNKYYYD